MTTLKYSFAINSSAFWIKPLRMAMQPPGILRTTGRSNQLKHALKRNVADGQKHDASGINSACRLFYAGRIFAPDRHFNAV
ncbi:MAG: hypothetical protein DMF99_32050 [Acidobacteria bacterium]|nr:MAG: hypothetical protein DMF99_32050 [Acidobacteriota bacterium]